MNLRIKKLDGLAKLPTKGSKGSACYDVYSTKRHLLSPNEALAVHTGLAFEVPEGYLLETRPRSGLAKRGLIILNSPGTLDSDYRGELLIIVKNISGSNLLVDRGDRVAQVRLEALVDMEFEEVEELSETERGEGGFGSTGK